MNEDLTQKTPDPQGDLLSLILTIVKKLDKHETILIQILDRLGKLESRVDAVEKRLDIVETRLNVIDGRLDTLEARLESFEKTIKRCVHYLDRKPTNSST